LQKINLFQKRCLFLRAFITNYTNSVSFKLCHYKHIITLKIVFKIFICALVLTLSLQSCSRKKDKFLSRNYHAVTTEYNVLFNGYNALNQGREALNNSYEDDYWEILPIERMQITEESFLPGQSRNADFTKAEEKAVAAIQKHGMNIGGKEKNPQIDEAYLLLGEARYYDQRFVPALEAFNYILYKYPLSDKINQAKVWREKTNIRLENNDVAIKNLKRLLEQEELEDQDLADATSILAQAYINTKSIDSALTQIKIATKSTKKNFEKARFNFIKGQLYNQLKQPDSANMAFDEVIDLNRKIPRKYLVAAYVEKTKNFDYKNGNKLEFEEHLKRLEEYYENRPYLDKIYHQIAEYNLKTGRDSVALAYYNKSLRATTKDKKLNAKNYLTLGDYYFDDANYQTAGAYFDSTMVNLKLNSKPYRVIKRKRENLDDVIKYEGVAEVNDSILKLTRMSETERLDYFTAYTDKLQAEAEAEKERLEIEARKKGLAVNDLAAGNFVKNKSNPSGPNSSFYFYNPTTVAYGKNEFSQVWGDRKNKDNWRWSSNKTVSFNNGAVATIDATVSQDSLKTFDPQFYIAKIPSEAKIIDSLQTDRNYAYYQLGLIYKEKFKEYTLSKDKFQELLKSNPEEKLILPSKYNLFKLNELLSEESQANFYKNDIIDNYSESRYAKILSNPEYAKSVDTESPDYVYAQTYKLLQEQKYAEVISESEKYANFFSDEPIQPKFELLKATAQGRLYGYKTYTKSLNEIALDYANKPEGLQAKSLVQSLKSVSDTTFVDNKDAKHFKAIYTFKSDEFHQIEDFKKRLSEAVKTIRYYDLSISEDIYNPETKFIVVHGIKSVEGAKGFTLLLKENKDFKKLKIDRPAFGISSGNYTIIQTHKNLNSYLELK